MNSVPTVIGIRLAPDVRIMLDRAQRRAGFRSYSRIGNLALRSFLTPIHAGKRVRNLQAKMGVQV